MKKLLSLILVICSLSGGNVYAENENFIKKHLASNSLYKQNPKTGFFFGEFKINSSFAKNINFYYAGSQETKDGQFYIFHLKNNNPIFLVSEETTFFMKEESVSQTFAPRSVDIKDLNNDGVNEVILKGKTWGTGSQRSFELAYFFEQGKKPNFVKKNYRHFKTYSPPQSYWNDLIPNNFRSNQNYIDFIKILEVYAPKVEGYGNFTSDDKEKKWHLTRLYPDFTVEHEFISGKVVKTKILIELYEPKITLDIYKNKKTISLLNKLFEDIYSVKNACKFNAKFECNFEIPIKYSSGLLY